MVAVDGGQMSNNGNGTVKRLIPLSSLQVGEWGRIDRLQEGFTFCCRLRDLGFVPGSLVRVRRRSPLRDPIEYEVRNTRICLRRRESDQILVHLPDEPSAP